MERKAGPGLIRRTLSGLWRPSTDSAGQPQPDLPGGAGLLVAGWLASRPAALPADAALLIAPGPARRAAQREDTDEPAAGRRRDAPGAAARRGRRDPRCRQRQPHQGAGDRDRQPLRCGLAKLEEIAEALDAFRKTGKKVHAWGRHFDQAQYHLAAHADEVFLNPDGYVLLTGFARYPTHFGAC